MDLKSLNERQREAVEATEGRIRVIAGAGSGKTRALAYRYAYIVNELGVEPCGILCLTFTNKAAQQMKSRISQLVPPGYANDLICTIHGFCVRFLREEIYRIGYPANFRILDEEDMKALARQVLGVNNQERSVKTVRSLLEALAGFKCESYIEDHVMPHDVPADRSAFPLHVQLLYSQVDKLSLDYDDLIAFTRHILHNFPDARTKWQEQLSYVMVDEAQDCNAGEWDIIETLSKVSGNLFVVGDPDQSIYEWRGARPDVFLRFDSERDIVLDQNYRSTANILGVANSIIGNNRIRLEKNMFTREGDGDSIIHFHAADERQEAAWICRRIMDAVAGGASYADFAVLFRASHLSRTIEQELIRNNVPYMMWGGVRFFERTEIKDCLSYLRLIAGDDDLAFERVINTPSRKVGKATLELVGEYADRDGLSLYTALKEHIDDPKLGRTAVKEFISVIESCRQRRDSAPVSVLLEYVLDKTGLKGEYRDDNDEQRLENITELMDGIRSYELEHEYDIHNLDRYLQDISLYTNADYRKDADKVRLMTVHQSKGLEFPYVFVAGLSEGIFPNARSIRERKASALEEERRLMYVAATRAEKCLYLTESEGYNAQARSEKLPSRFIAEISRQYYVTEGDMDEALWARLKNQIELEKIILSQEDGLPEGADGNGVAISPGNMVRHRLFGTGTVLSVYAGGSCKVRFDSGLTRFLRKDVLEKVVAVQIRVPSDGKHLN